MNKYLSIIFFSSLLYGMKSEAQQNVGLYYYPTYEFRNIDFDYPAFNHAIGIISNFKLNKKFSTVAKIGYKYEKYDPISFTNMFWDRLYPIYYYTKLINADCHLKINISRENKKIVLYAFSGPNLNTALYEKTDLTKTNKIKIHSVHAQGGMGCSLKIKSFFIDIAPTYEIQIWQNRKNLTEDYENRFGINIGIGYNIEKRKQQ